MSSFSFYPPLHGTILNITHAIDREISWVSPQQRIALCRNSCNHNIRKQGKKRKNGVSQNDLLIL
jgi:hypothetical protein